MLPNFEPDSFRANEKHFSAGGESLLYRTYDDYFNMEEEEVNSPVVTISTIEPSEPARTLTPPPSQPPEPEKLNVSTDFSNTPFFFVLSATSPISPSEAVFTPISPLKPGDIPDALADLLPQPSNSLLEVINVAKLGSFPGKTSERGRSPAVENEASLAPLNKKTITLKSSVSPRSTSPSNRPSQLQLRNSTAAVPMSGAIRALPQIPGSSTVEVSSSPLGQRRPDPLEIRDPQMRVTYHPTSSSPTPHAPSALRPRTREAQSMDVVSVTPKVIDPVRGHVRGVSSPFPLPIAFNFAPPSVPGSARTPYSYF
ncbi:hypothetical protein NP233_g3373 [Leucocoprinus birnbaumii]|uniref:Uncharacterized protein n=1 Tax=Leucocoprinus birnbaumii TaxID=56174 RepID=A0AAD5W0F1_9AGAR|nr:hypothetical protein NP233_g3373 [Leucocoprinus birnbaumii]